MIFRSYDEDFCDLLVRVFLPSWVLHSVTRNNPMKVYSSGLVYKKKNAKSFTTDISLTLSYIDVFQCPSLSLYPHLSTLFNDAPHLSILFDEALHPSTLIDEALHLTTVIDEASHPSTLINEASHPFTLIDEGHQLPYRS